PPAPAAAAAADRPGTVPARLAVLALVGSTFVMACGVVVREPGFVQLGALLALAGLPVLTREGPRVPSVAALPEVRRFLAARPGPGTPGRVVTDFLASLQPAWWVARALVAAAVVLWVVADVEAGPVLLLDLVTVPASVWVGRRSQRDRRWLWAVVPLNGVAAVLSFLGLVVSGAAVFQPASNVSYAPYHQPGLWQDDREIRDIRPVDANGNPLTDVYLFDQDGRPINTADHCYDGYGDPGYPTTDPVRPYPRGVKEYDSTGRCVTVPPGPLVVAVPSAAPSASAAPGVPAPPADAGPTTVPPSTAPPLPTTVPPPPGG
ncbi:hypothetical protein, partial [Pseudonocardia nigra]|uniref:hypothetical protein n=1 Tax=Pseudonocardia nigra TaxID=1921578 RepID=UPI001C5DA3EE